MNKYEDALIAYATTYDNIKSLTRKISLHSCIEADYDTPPSLVCKQIIDNKTCLERLWERNKQQRCNDESSEYGFDAETLPEVKLCFHCSKAQKYINLRKAAKSRLGVEKRRLLQLGRGLVKRGIDKP